MEPAGKTAWAASVGSPDEARRNPGPFEKDPGYASLHPGYAENCKAWRSADSGLLRRAPPAAGDYSPAAARRCSSMARIRKASSARLSRSCFAAAALSCSLSDSAAARSRCVASILVISLR